MPIMAHCSPPATACGYVHVRVPAVTAMAQYLTVFHRWWPHLLVVALLAPLFVAPHAEDTLVVSLLARVLALASR